MKKRIAAIMMVLTCVAGTLCAQTDNRSDTIAPINGDNINKSRKARWPRRGAGR
ncbi:MAG: hypothetical protein IKM98_04685 [Bacteroidales bacterium]|nr:hypothetical protein [Bacteroidales bacterium]